MMRLISKLSACFFSAVLMCACSDVGAQSAQGEKTLSSTMVANWDVQSSSAIVFSSSYDGDVFEGRFNTFTVQIQFDADALSTSRVVAEIEVASVDAADAERTDALSGKDWFFAKSFPKAVFTSTAFTHLGGDQYKVEGDFTLRGISKPLILPFTLIIENDVALMVGAFELNRRDFDVGRGMWKSEDYIPHTVKVRVEVQAHKNTP